MNWRMEVLQTSALPLGYAAKINLERETGFEPATSTLARLHSTTELLPLNGLWCMRICDLCQALLQKCARTGFCTKRKTVAKLKRLRIFFSTICKYNILRMQSKFCPGGAQITAMPPEKPLTGRRQVQMFCLLPSKQIAHII